MSTQRMLGIVLLVVGVIFLVIGMNSSNSMADQVSNTFSGRFTERTTWYIIGGIAVGLLGLAMVLFGGSRRRLA
jgi:drug/metabolite transporter (DMT)-like permease